MVDNFCDVAHFPYVHAGTTGPDSDPVVAPIEVGALRQRMSTAFHLPFVVRSNAFYESGQRAGHDRVLLLCATPIDDITSLFTFVSWRNHDHELSVEEFLAFDRAIGSRGRGDD